MTNFEAPKKYLLLRRKDRLLALPVECVSEVLECNEVFPLPSDDPKISGLILSADAAVPLLRLDDDLQAKPRIAILIRTSEGLVGIPADEVIRVDYLNEMPMPETFETGPRRAASRWPGLIRGIGTMDQQNVLFLDPGAIIKSGTT